MMALFLHFFYLTYLRTGRSRQVEPATSQLKSATMMTSNGHIDSQNNDARKSSDNDFVHNNNLIANASKKRKEQ